MQEKHIPCACGGLIDSLYVAIFSLRSDLVDFLCEQQSSESVVGVNWFATIDDEFDFGATTEFLRGVAIGVHTLRF